MLKKFPSYIQLDAMDCGATCLKMICKYYKKDIPIERLRELCHTNREGVSVQAINDAAETIGMHTLAAKLSYEALAKEAPLPCIIYWRERHFVVVHKISKGKVYISDPAYGLTTYSEEEFKKAWLTRFQDEGNEEGFAIFMEPTPEFYSQTDENVGQKRKISLKYYLGYLKPYKKEFIQLVISLAIGTVLQVFAPFMTQSLVDIGISNHDLSFIHIILIAQLVLFLSIKAGDFIRGWLSMFMISKVNIALLSNFLLKLMKLPVSFFDKKTPGDLIKRIDDHNRIQLFLTTTTIHFIFTFMSILVFGGIMAFYNITIFLIYLVGTALYFLWVILFMRKRRDLDHRNFDQSIEIQNNTLQIVHGIKEIKLQNCETQKRWEWERIQAKLFKLNLKGLVLQQMEDVGSSILNEGKNIILTFFAATLVISGDITLGMMISIQYIVGQLNWMTPGIITFLHQTQEAKLSIDRLAEIHNQENEDVTETDAPVDLSEKGDITLNNVSFQYGGKHSAYVLKDINLVIPKNKVTAIVGSSGSGKTTLLNLLLKSYQPVDGDISYGKHDITQISFKDWREKFACVTQDSYIFSDSIAYNIAVGEEKIDPNRLREATINANIREFIEELPIEYNTKIGPDGIGLSQGQKQRLLLARAMYKNPEILLLDEATNALDAKNEKVIINNINKFSENRTVIVVAHRLSTVKDADQIIVLEKGEIIEIGNHTELIEKKGAYHSLIKNQLEIAS